MVDGDTLYCPAEECGLNRIGVCGARRDGAWTSAYLLLLAGSYAGLEMYYAGMFPPWQALAAFLLVAAENARRTSERRGWQQCPHECRRKR